MALSNLACKQAAPRDKSYKLSDGDGMYLLVTPVGGKYWRVDYRFDGKRKTAALGCYPDVTLQRAREKRLELRQQLDSGLDPVSAKKQAKLLRALDRDASFESVAREWHENRAALWTPHYAKQVLSVLERDFFPDLGAYGIKEITPPILLETLRKIEDRGALDALADARGYAGAIFRYGTATASPRAAPTGIQLPTSGTRSGAIRRSIWCPCGTISFRPFSKHSIPSQADAGATLP